jgi:hypothetical protein
MFGNLFKKKQQIEISASKIASDILKPKTFLTEDEIQICVELEFNRRQKKVMMVENQDYFDQNELDSIIKEAAEIVVKSQQGTASLLQRKLKLGYNRAGRLIDQLEGLGIIGSFEGSKTREVNIKSLAELESVFQTGEYLSENCKLFKRDYLHLSENQITQRIEDYSLKLVKDELEKEREQIKLEILEAENKKKEKERLRTLRREIEKELSESGEIKILLQSKRERISQDVMDLVWNRDGGKCVQCGKSEKLEFDHILPFSKGGNNTYRNIQLLCENCNRVKSNKLG